MNDDNRPTFIYALIEPNTNNDVRYIGKTVQPLEKRLTAHINDKSVNHRTRWIQSIVKRGLKPIIRLIEIVPANENWVMREQFNIELYREWGYDLTNNTDGGEGATGRIVTDETRAKMSESNKLRHQKQHYPCTDETRAKMSESGKASHKKRRRTHSDETKSKISKLKRGTKCTDETRAKMRNAKQNMSDESKANLGGWNAKCVNQYTLEWVFIRTWESASVASKCLNIVPSGITECCKKSRKKAGGFRWSYSIDDVGYINGD